MTTKLILAAISGLLFAGHALAETAATPQKLNIYHDDRLIASYMLNEDENQLADGSEDEE